MIFIHPVAMQVKDIRKFREFYKAHIKRTLDNDRNPHFAGEEKIIDGKTEFGFFEMFNGQGDIENKLTTILNIAGDSQAIYEFMQNAVDADSNNFFLAKYGTEEKPYLIVLNDGSYFNLQSVISILAIGASSKYRNPDNIGQFGVGFKLAHRLIGADNSIKELLEENKGPILFSWSNGELVNLPSIDKISLIDADLNGVGKNAVSNNNAPWLFKIVATNFPCLTDDSVWDAKGRYSPSLFTEEDFAALKGAAEQVLRQIKGSAKYMTGTLLVIPLHPNKVEHVIGKVPKGLEIAATIISRRVKKSHDIRTQIENEELHPEYLYSEHWELNSNETAGKLGNEQVKAVELMFLYSNPLDSNPFKGKPQFYRYFPMSLEQHGFRFAIHGNALTVSSARTELQENDSNKFLLAKLVPLVDKKLKEYTLTNDTKFYHLYLSLLLSQRGEGSNKEWIQGRNWLEAVLWLPLINVLKDNLPLKTKDGIVIADKPDAVLIKNSKLPIEAWYKKNSCQWFFWEQNDQPLVCFEASALDKLNLKSINILDVLSDPDCIEPINKWLLETSTNNSDLLKELNETSFVGYEKADVWKNLSALRLWRFQDDSYTIDLLVEDRNLKYNIINYGPINEIKEILKKVGIHSTDLYLDDYKRIERAIRETNQKSLPYLFNYEELNMLLGDRFIKTAELSTEDKKNIFTSIESAVRSSANTSLRRIETMKTLALFSNKMGEVKPLYQLTSLASVPEMLQGWRIKEGEVVNLNIKEYVSDSKEGIYEHIIKPFWNDIVVQAEQNQESRKALFGYAKECYKLKPSLGGLNPDEIFFTEAGDRLKHFYHPSLVSLSEIDYSTIADILRPIGINFPQYGLLPFYKEPPFLLPVTGSVNLDGFSQPLSKIEARVIVRWVSSVFPDALKDRLFVQLDEENITISYREQGVSNYFSNKISIHQFVARFLKPSLVPVPEVVQEVIGSSFLHGEKLLERLVHDSKDNQSAFIELVQILMEEGNDDIIKKFLSNVSPIEIKSDIEVNGLSHNLLKLCFSIRKENIKKEVLEKLISIRFDEKLIVLHDIQNRGSDLIHVNSPLSLSPLSINSILGGDANRVNHTLRESAMILEDLELGNVDQIALALGINEQRSTVEVWNNFIDTLSSNPINNGHQLAFIFLMNRSNEVKKIDPKIETIGGWVPIQGAFYLKDLDFIPEDRVLHERYNDIAFVLKMEEQVIDANLWSVQSEPFLTGSNLIMPDINAINEPGRPSFWKFLFDCWESSNQPEKIVIKDINQNWEPLLGLSPGLFVLNNDYCLDEEKLPIDLIESYGLPKIKVESFFAVLGAHSDNSAVVRTRKYFKKDGGSIDTSMSLPQTINTLKWLATNNIAISFLDVSSFYRNLNGKYPINYFPASTQQDTDGLRIVNISEGANLISREDLEKARNLDIKLSEISKAAKMSIINLANLQDWSVYLSKTVPSINIKWRETNWNQIENDAKEWTYPFYIEWKNKYHYLSVNAIPGSELYRIVLVNGNIVKQYRKDKIEISTDKNIVYVDGSEVETLLDLIDEKNIFDTNARAYLRQCYKAQTEQFAKFMDLAKKDSGFAQLLKEHAEAIKLQEERHEKAQMVKDAGNQYSLAWFLNLLELVRVQERSANIPEVSFSKCELVPAAQRTFELSDCIGRIPSNIDTYDEIPAVITYKKDNGESTTANTKLIASEKHQKLWVMFPEMSVQHILDEPKKIVSVRLIFTRTVDLIEELKNGFNGLRVYGLQDHTNLKTTLTSNIEFIFGPPGTGKTTKLAERVINRHLDGISGPVIILAPTNKAADVLAKKIIAKNNNTVPDWLIRMGTCTDPYLLEEKVLKSGMDLLVQAHSDNVYITTIHRFPYFTVPINPSTTDRARLCDCPWSEVIFDESSMIPLAYITHAIQKCQHADNPPHFVVAGDPLQIPPVFDLMTEDLEDYAEDLQEQNIYSMIGLNSFNEDEQHAIPVYGNSITNLDVQYRSVPVIGDLFSKFSYGGKGKIQNARGTNPNTKPSKPRDLPPKFNALGFKPITIIRYPVKSGDSIFKPQKLEGSPLHIYSALLINELIRFFRKEVIATKDKPWTLGVLAPYRSQADLILKMIEAHSHGAKDVKITTDTVHGFQGDENEIVFAVFNPSGTGDNISYSRFLKKEFIINVAISRAEDYLIMFIPDDDSKGLNGLPLVNRLIQLAKETDPSMLAIMHSSELEHKLTGDDKFFQMKSFSTAHQKINVYGKPDLPYVIRINEKSLDVHWAL